MAELDHRLMVTGTAGATGSSKNGAGMSAISPPDAHPAGAHVRADKEARRRRTAVIPAVLICVAATVLLVILNGRGPVTAPGAGKAVDATTMVSTIIGMYTFFLAAYGALSVELARNRLESWSLTALVFMFAAVVLDLGRLVNSTGDLVRATTRNMSYADADDAAREFQRYLITNGLVLIFTLCVLCSKRFSEGKSRRSATAAV
jgi:hypothetical protein